MTNAFKYDALSYPEVGSSLNDVRECLGRGLVAVADFILPMSVSKTQDELKKGAGVAKAFFLSNKEGAFGNIVGAAAEILVPALFYPVSFAVTTACNVAQNAPFALKSADNFKSIVSFSGMQATNMRMLVMFGGGMALLVGFELVAGCTSSENIISIGQNVTIDHSAQITGRNVTIGPDVTVDKDVVLSCDNFHAEKAHFGAGTKFHCDSGLVVNTDIGKNGDIGTHPGLVVLVNDTIGNDVTIIQNAGSIHAYDSRIGNGVDIYENNVLANVTVGDNSNIIVDNNQLSNGVIEPNSRVDWPGSQGLHNVKADNFTIK